MPFLTVSLASKRVMELPELLKFIFETLGVGELAQLLSVNRLFFECAAPLVWHTVWGVEVLLGLLIVTDLPVLASGARWPEVELDRDVIQAKLPRFTLYSPMVQKLYIFRHTTRGYRWLGLENLGPRALLLPCLTELVIRRRSDGAHSTMLPKVLALFCNSSCMVVRAGGTLESSVPWLSHTDCGLALAAIRPLAPSLNYLDLFVNDAESPFGHGTSLALSLEQMKSLKILGLGCHSLCDEVLAAVGRIRGLKVLTLRFRQNPHQNISKLQIPDGSFTELSRLIVLGAWPDHLLHLVKLRPLISSIRSARLDVFEGTVMDRHLDRVFQTLRDDAEHLRDLDICFPRPVQGPYEIRSSQLMLILSEIPLKRISLHNVCLPQDQDFGDLLRQCKGWRKTLAQFIMPDQPASLQDMEQLAKFSRLELLALNLQVTDIPVIRQTNPKPISSQVLRVESYFQLHNLLPDAVDKLALFLLTCWNDIIPVMARRKLQEDEHCDMLDNWVYVTLLKELARLKGREQTANTVQWG